jgi:hypothetical protein
MLCIDQKLSANDKAQCRDIYSNSTNDLIAKIDAIRSILHEKMRAQKK